MKNYKIEIKWAVVFILATLVWAILEKSLGFYDEKIESHGSFSFLFAIVAVLLYVLALLDKKKNFFQGNMNWKQGFISGIILSVFIAILTPIGQVIIHNVIAPNFFENFITYSVEKGVLNKENAEAYFNLTSYIVQSVFFALSVGVVTAAIVAFFIKSKEN